MELRHLRYFVAVAEKLNFTKAARTLQIAQPPLSRQIRDLEAEVGVVLFERNRGRVFLTDAGLRFLNEVRVVLQHVSQAVDAARQASAGGVGTIRLGIGKGLGDVVSRVVNEYLRFFPRMEFDVRDIPSGFQSEAFAGRKIDVGFMRPPVNDLQLDSALLFKERFTVVVRKTSALLKHRRLRLRHLAGQSLLLIDRHISPGAYDKTLELFRASGVTPKIIPTSTMPYDEGGAVLVESGRGIYLALGKNPIHPSFADRLVALPLAEPSAVIEVQVVWDKNEQSKTTLDFVKFTRSMFHNGHGLGQRRIKAVKPPRGSMRRGYTRTFPSR